jgi:type VI secretion system protein ImpA
MNDEAWNNADAYLLQYLELQLATLLAPIEAVAPDWAVLPAGPSLRGEPIYREIRQARAQDDASLPMGGWERDLKRADWAGLSRLAAQALAYRSKDLQLAAWLLEAQLNLRGFDAIAPCITLIQGLCERFWDGLHPQPSDGSYEHRANLLRWINEKLLTVVRQIALTQSGQEHEFNWTDWERVQRHEQMRSAANGKSVALEGPDLAEVARAMSATPANFYLTLFHTLADASEALGLLGEVLDLHFDGDAPGLSAFSGALLQIKALAGAELHKRGMRPVLDGRALQPPAALGARAAAPGAPAAPAAPQPRGGSPRDLGGEQAVEGSRMRAYAQLTEAADTLLRLEPHSPVPYMIRKAVEWGSLDTVQLYQELFLQQGGQLNIFKLLGLDPATAAK